MNSLKNSFVNEILDLFISEISKDETKNKINTYIIEPSFTYMFDRIYPYLILTFIIKYLTHNYCIPHIYTHLYTLYHYYSIHNIFLSIQIFCICILFKFSSI